jgi:hypothetical protein
VQGVLRMVLLSSGFYVHIAKKWLKFVIKVKEIYNNLTIIGIDFCSKS